ncbi:thioredoxin domain containing protein [Cryptosporidium ryanae]|uniref:thioredoxin domain containing protein n=1 Tax=Cryptosporidium ryanae TaxID=515981 RepID=UPI00351A7B79|nr:thioredoxin domain containing protein [Cryptosporidium ryanae]
MVICLGPFCIPLWNLLFLILGFLGPVYNLFFNNNSTKKQEEVSKAKGKIRTDSIDRDTDNSEKSLRECVNNSQVYELSDENEWEMCKKVGKELNLPIILDFYADWCGPCKRISPKYHQLCKKYKGIFIKVNCDDLNDFSNEMDVTSLPTFYTWILSKDGECYCLSNSLKTANPDLLEDLLINSKFTPFE